MQPSLSSLGRLPSQVWGAVGRSRGLELPPAPQQPAPLLMSITAEKKCQQPEGPSRSSLVSKWYSGFLRHMPWEVELISQKITQVSSSFQPFSKLRSLHVAPVNSWHFWWAHRSQQTYPLDGLIDRANDSSPLWVTLMILLPVHSLSCSLSWVWCAHCSGHPYCMFLFLLQGRASGSSTPFPCLYVRCWGRINLKKKGVFQLIVLRLMVGKAWWWEFKTAGQTVLIVRKQREQWWSLLCFVPFTESRTKAPS